MNSENYNQLNVEQEIRIICFILFVNLHSFTYLLLNSPQIQVLEL